MRQSIKKWAHSTLQYTTIALHGSVLSRGQAACPMFPWTLCPSWGGQREAQSRMISEPINQIFVWVDINYSRKHLGMVSSVALEVSLIMY